MKGVDEMPVPKGKEKFAIWVHPEIKEKVKEIYKQDDCRTQSEFMEKAAKFYIGYLTAENKTNYPSTIKTSSVIEKAMTAILRLFRKRRK